MYGIDYINSIYELLGICMAIFTVWYSPKMFFKLILVKDALSVVIVFIIVGLHLDQGISLLLVSSVTWLIAVYINRLKDGVYEIIKEVM